MSLKYLLLILCAILVIICKIIFKDPNIPLIPKREEPSPIPPKKKVDCRPLPISRILADNIKPEKEEYAELKELDTRMHALKFSQDMAKKCSQLNRPDSAPMSLNRYNRL